MCAVQAQLHGHGTATHAGLAERNHITEHRVFRIFHGLTLVGGGAQLNAEQGERPR